MFLHGIFRDFKKRLLIGHNYSLENLSVLSPSRNCWYVRAHENSRENFHAPLLVPLCYLVCSFLFCDYLLIDDVESFLSWL